MTPFEKLVPIKKLNFTFLSIKNLYYTFLCFKNYSTNIPKYSFINNYLKNIDINQYFLNYSEKSKKNISTKNNYQKQVTNNILGLYVLKHWFEFKIYHGFLAIVENSFCFSADNFSQISDVTKVSVLKFIPQFRLNSFYREPIIQGYINFLFTLKLKIHIKSYLNFVLSKSTIKLQYLTVNHG